MRIPDYPAGETGQWAAVDRYFGDLLCPADAAQEQALTENARAGLPPHDVSAPQGKLLALYIRMMRASRVLEIGTLGGYSTIWMARALPSNGQLVTIEANPRHAEVARANIARAGLSDRVDLREGPALEILPALQAPFDLVFIDADKPNNPQYLAQALRLTRPGSVIIGDNVVRGGAVVDPDSGDANVQGMRQFLQMIADHPGLDATAIQTAGEKGWDGFALAVVR